MHHPRRALWLHPSVIAANGGLGTFPRPTDRFLKTYLLSGFLNSLQKRGVKPCACAGKPVPQAEPSTSWPLSEAVGGTLQC